MRGNIKLYRKEIELWKKLSDQELRIYLLLRVLADWDKKHKNTFGTVRSTLDDLRSYLPERGSSKPKLSYWLKILESKHFIKRIKDGQILVENYAVYQLPVHLAEQCIQSLEQGIQPPEHLVQNSEEERRKFIEERKRSLVQKWKPP